jgi:hypothetical protein
MGGRAIAIVLALARAHGRQAVVGRARRVARGSKDMIRRPSLHDFTAAQVTAARDVRKNRGSIATPGSLALTPISRHVRAGHVDAGRT